MKLRKELLQGIEQFFVSLPVRTVQRGRGCFNRGDVLELTCITPEEQYAAVVRSGKEHDVSLDFFEGEWDTNCSCRAQTDCAHAVAALLELRHRARASGASSTSTRARIAAAAKTRWQKAKGALPPERKTPRVPQPARSPLCDKLSRQLGRELVLAETEFVRCVQALYSRVSERAPSECDLAPLAITRNFYGWQPLKLWPEAPRDDFYLWLYVAWELRRRNARWPAFMDAITDFSLIEPAMKQWEREKEIEHWKDWFREFNDPAPVSDVGTLELRLIVLADEARLQWRTGSNGEFAELKQAHAKKFADQFDKGALTLAPESLPLWSATYKPWHYESWWSFRYSNATARPALNRLLRMPLAPDRVVTADGQPLARPPEPLHLHLRPPQTGDGQYELALAAGDGSPPPRILCTLQGQPTLYLTERGLFYGPPAAALDTALRKTIPADALETADGLRFLHATGVPLPKHLSERIRTVPVVVTISCALKTAYPGCPTEDICIRVIAKAPALRTEEFTPQGWTASSPFDKAKKLQTANGIIAVHDRAAQKHIPRVLEPLGLKWEGYPGHWKLRLTKKTPEAFVPWLKSLPPEIEVVLDEELATLRDEPVSGTVSLDVVEAGIDWFDLKVALNASDTTLTPEELRLLLNARGGYVRLGKKGWRRLHFNLSSEENEQLARLGLDARDFSSEPQRFHALQLADAAAKKFLAPERVERIQRRVSELKARVAPPLPQTLRADLRPYQIDGFHFLAYLTTNRFGGVLADDMGLGKTLQTLAWLAWLQEAESVTPGPPLENPETSAGGAPDFGVRRPAGNGTGTAAAGHSASEAGTLSEGAVCCHPAAVRTGAPHPGALPSLVVCPKSVMDNWRTEAERFFPSLRVRLWRGDSVDALPAARETADLVVVNYTQLRSLSPAIANVEWLATILDEAQYIKNPNSQTAQAARALKAGHRLALTGTPIENRLLDLWSIFGYAMPGALGNRAHFLRRFDANDDPLGRRRLSARVRPFLLRRTKAQVAKDLPERIEEDLLCEMEGEQKALYSAELKRARRLILGLKTHRQLNEERFNILTALLRLRQICCHPALVDQTLRGAESAKVAALEDLLEPLMEEGHKVLVFSQFVTMLELLRETVQQGKWPHFYLAGDTEQRGELVEAFQSVEGGAVFLISLRAGGFGLNLTAASYVVLFDPWWNPAVENQAIDRTHRIGQTSNVMAYRLLMRESIEQKIRELQKQKTALAEDVLGEERFAQSLTLEDLRFLFSQEA